MTSEHLDRT